MDAGTELTVIVILRAKPLVRSSAVPSVTWPVALPLVETSVQFQVMAWAVVAARRATAAERMKDFMRVVSPFRPSCTEGTERKAAFPSV